MAGGLVPPPTRFAFVEVFSMTSNTDLDDDLRSRLRSKASGRNDELSDLLSAAASEIESQQDRVAELQQELEETNEGMVALTLELEKAEQRYRSLFENAVEGIYKTTPDGRRYVMANSSMANILGYDSAETLQRSVSDIRTDVFVDGERYDEYKNALRSGDSIENYEYRVERADGEIRWVSDNANTLYDNDEAAGIRGGIVDVTEVKKYERRLETKNQELEALNRVVRHDINNDIQIVRGIAGQLENEVADDHREAIQRIIAASDHIVDLTRDARDFIEVVSGREEAELEPVSLGETLEYEIERTRNSFSNASVTVETPLPETKVTANGMLGSVFRNLLNNAVRHHHRDDPAISIDWEMGSEKITVRVADDGPGIPDDRKDEIFGKGEQSLESQGTGIGLYLVRELVTIYGGDIWVEDRSDRDSGSVFVVTLPLVDQST